MKKIFTFIITAVLALSTAISVQASPAYPYPIKFTQPDGSVITIQMHGDEFYSWTTDENGNEIEMGEDGFYHKVLKPLTAEEKSRASLNSPVRESNSQIAPQRAAVAGNPSFLVILINFANKSFEEGHGLDAFNKMQNEPGYSENGAIGSAYDYFNDNSNGKFKPIFDVFGPITVSENFEEYGRNTSAHDWNGVARALVEACYLLDSQIDFTKYDHDNDGVIDNIFFYFAGRGEADGGGDNTIWPHKWGVYSSLEGYANEYIPSSNNTVTYKNLTLDGKKFYNYSTQTTYACTCEISSDLEMCGIGTFCHEFSHTLGLPDYYDTDYSENGQGDGLFHYSVMSSGNYNSNGRIPPYYTAIDKVKMGWTSWTSLTSGQSYTLNDSNKMTAYRTILSSSGSDEYFVYEARNGQKWDSPLPTGLLIYHVRESIFSSNGNKYGNNPGIYFKAAYPSSLTPPHASEANVPYPGPKNVTAFDNNSPSPATDWNGKWHGDEISNIKYDGSNHQVTFTYTKKDPNKKTMSGKITDYSTGQGISGASIVVSYVGGTKSATSGPDGSYSFDFGSISNPAFSVSISKSGYLSLDKDDFTHPGGEYVKNFALIPSSAAENGIELKRYNSTSTSTVHRISGATDMVGCIRFSAAEMKPFVGMKITEISFKISGSVSKEAAVVWFGSEQVLNQSVSHVAGKFNTTTVEKGGLTIQEGKDVYVGYSVQGAEYPYYWDETTTDNEGCYVKLITENSWTNWCDKGSLLISFKVMAEKKDEMYNLGYSGLNLNPDETISRPYSGSKKISLSLVGSNDPVKTVTYQLDNGTASSDGITIYSNTSKGDHTIKAEVEYQSGKKETIIQVIKVQ